MIHLTGKIASNGLIAAIKQRAGGSAKPIQIFGIGQRRWTQHLKADQSPVFKKSPASLRLDKKEKISPLGWFLLLIPITTFGLGCWQVKRKAWKEQLIKDLERYTNMAPVPLPENLSTVDELEYRPLIVRGRFLHDKELLMGPRHLIRPNERESASGGLFSQRHASNGYLVITPFKLADRDDIILINRGWVSYQQMKPETRAAGQIEGEVELTGIVRKGERRIRFTPEHNDERIFLYRDLPKMCSLTGAVPVFLDANYASSVPGGPIGGQTRLTLRNEHLSYLITWYSLSLATALLWYHQIVKRKPFF